METYFFGKKQKWKNWKNVFFGKIKNVTICLGKMKNGKKVGKNVFGKNGGEKKRLIMVIHG